MRSRALLGACLVIFSLAGIAGLDGAAAGASTPSTAATAKTCRAGFAHAVINHHQKCLHAGEFCSRHANRQYRRYGFYCPPSRHLRYS